MREVHHAFMAYKADHGGQISTRVPISWTDANDLMRGFDTSNVMGSWGGMLYPNYLQMKPGPGPLAAGGTLNRRLAFCPEYKGDHVMGPRHFGLSVPRVLLSYAQLIDNLADVRWGSVPGPTPGRNVLVGDNYWPIYTSPTNLNNVFAGGYRMLEPLRHGRLADSLNFIFADGHAETLARPASGTFASIFDRFGFSSDPARAHLISTPHYPRTINFMPFLEGTTGTPQ